MRKRTRAEEMLLARFENYVRHKILAYFRARGAAGATDSEGRAALGMIGHKFEPVRAGLIATGHVVDAGQTRTTSAGEEQVWRIATVCEYVCFTGDDEDGGHL